MPKGYWVARIDVHNPDGYKEYVAQKGAVFAKYGGKFLVRGGRHVSKEGSARTRNVVIEFESYDAARAYYYSTEYQAAKAKREGAAIAELVLVEGV